MMKAVLTLMVSLTADTEFYSFLSRKEEDAHPTIFSFKIIVQICIKFP